MSILNKFLSGCLLLALGLLTACGGGGGGNTPAPTPTYSVTFVAGAGGTLTGTASQTVTSGGSASAITAVASPGYTFTSWTGSNFTTSTSNPLVVSNVVQALTITANFTPTFTVSFVSGTGGSLSGTTPQTVASGGSTSALTATVNPGYVFVNWTGTGFTTTATNPLVIANVTQNLTITANFAPTYTVTFIAGTGGSLSGTTNQTIVSGGSTLSLTATANQGYVFVNWTGTGFTTITTNPLVVANVTQTLTITANFAPTYTLGFVAGTGGVLTGAATQTVVSGGSTSAVNAVSNTGFAFANWSGSGFPGSTANPLVVANVTQNMTITANFTSLTSTLVYTDPSSGSYQLKKNTTLSTAAHLVLDLVGPANTGSGVSATLTADTTKVTWANVAASDAPGTYVQNVAFTLGAVPQALKGKVTGSVLQVTSAQKGTASPISLNTALLRVALDLKLGVVPGTITLTPDATKCQVIDSTGAITGITVTVGTLTAQ